MHWVPHNVLYLPKEEGGQRLVHLQSRTAAFRLQFIQRFLTGPENLSWRSVASMILKTAEGLCLDKSLLHLHFTFTFMHLADAFIQSDLQLHSGYTCSLVCVFPGNRTHNLLRC